MSRDWGAEAVGLRGADTLDFCLFSARDASWPAVSPLLPLGQANKPRALRALPAQLTAGYGQQDKLALESCRALSPAASARWAEAPGSSSKRKSELQEQQAL